MVQGSMVALVTPMHADGSLDDDALARLIEWHIEQGTDAIVAVGTTGESPTLSPDEHISIIRRTIELVDGRVPVIAGAGANATNEAVHLASSAAAAGADATLQVVPYYNKPPQAGLYRHFRTIAEAVDLPHILYNVPGRTGADLLPETIEHLCTVDNIVAVKEATGDPQRARQILDRVGSRLEVYSGEDPTARELMLIGGHGTISVTANVAPNLMHRMCIAAASGDREQAEALDAELEPLHRALFSQTNPIAVKWALYEMGRIESGIRLPLTPLAEDYREAVRQALDAVDAR